LLKRYFQDRKSVKDVTIAIHTPDNDEEDKKLDQLEEEMIRDYNSESNGDES